MGFVYRENRAGKTESAIFFSTIRNRESGLGDRWEWRSLKSNLELENFRIWGKKKSADSSRCARQIRRRVASAGVGKRRE